ncbi:MAG: DUF1799 domain-containing protein [Sphingopyxis sp.]|nr:DUF1799 domain-containing protein [Sphingopyxis sp.]
MELAPSAADSIALFFALGTQWRVHPMSGARIGIDYTAVRPTAELLGLPLDADVMADLRSMEMAALDEFTKARPARVGR